MSDRERWTVYPLLFLALGVGLRGSGKFGPTKQISCHRLHIERPDGKVQMELSAAPDANGGGGVLRVISDDGKVGVELRAVSQGGIIQAIGANGQPQVLLESTPVGGALATFSPDRTPLVVVEPTRLGAAVTTFGLHGHAQQSLGIPWNRFQVQPAQAPPDADKPEPAEQNSTAPEQPAEHTDTKAAEPSDEPPASTEHE